MKIILHINIRSVLIFDRNLVSGDEVVRPRTFRPVVTVVAVVIAPFFVAIIIATWSGGRSSAELLETWSGGRSSAEPLGTWSGALVV